MLDSTPTKVENTAAAAASTTQTKLSADSDLAKPSNSAIATAGSANSEGSKDSTSFLGKAASEVADFGEGLFHGAVESPINGAVQLTNYVAHTDLPELHLVDDNKVENTVGGKIGSMAGTALDMIGLTMATGGLGDAGVAASALRLGAVGAAYTTLLQPTDPSSGHLIEDRLKNGAVAFGTFAAMGAAGAAMETTGLLATSAARSFVASTLTGAASGAVGGLAHSEANALINEGKLLPSGGEVMNDVENYAAFGAAFGAAGYGINRALQPAAKSFDAEGNKLTVQEDRQGNPVSLTGETRGQTDPNAQIQWSGTKMANGTWTSKAWEKPGTEQGYDYVVPPGIEKVQTDGSQAIVTGGGIERVFNDGGTYTRTNLVRQQAELESAKATAAYNAKYNPTEDIDGATVGRSYDQKMNLTGLTTRVPGSDSSYDSSASINYDQNNNVTSLSVSEKGSPTIALKKTGDNSWTVYRDNTNYKWNGEVKVIPNGGAGHPEQLQFIPADGKPAANFDVTKGIKPVADMMDTSATYVPGGTGRPVVKVDQSGNASITGGTSNWQKAIVNGQELKAGETAAIKPGDSVQMSVDIGDRYPQYELRNVVWSTSYGEPVLGTTELKPGTVTDFDANAGGTEIAEEKK